VNFFKTPIHYLHIGKTGGTSIVHHLKEINAEVNTPYQFCFYQHQVHLTHLPKNQLYFFSLRDPISRFVSGFYSTKNQNKGVPWTQLETTAFNFFPEANFLAESLSDTTVWGGRAHDAMRAIKHVSDFQCSWLEPQALIEKYPPMQVLFQETLEADFNAMLSKLSLPPLSMTLQNKAVEQSLQPLSATAIDNLKIWYSRDFNFIFRMKQLNASFC
jgi:hypothetical protein